MNLEHEESEFERRKTKELSKMMKELSKIEENLTEFDGSRESSGEKIHLQRFSKVRKNDSPTNRNSAESDDVCESLDISISKEGKKRKKETCF